MSDLIRQALGWTDGPWPPDFYALLGLAGPIDPDQVEAAVLERMEKLRVFQLVHPESVTEAMNLLARALITLSDPAAKSEYDARHPATHANQRSEENQNRTDVPELAATNVPAVLDQPNRPSAEKPNHAAPTKPPLMLSSDPSEPPITRPPTSHERSLTGEWQSLSQRTTRRPVRRKPRKAEQTIVRWVVQLRRLLDAWDEAGTWLAIPELTFATRIEAVEVILALRLIAHSAPAIIDIAGPGSAVVNLAQSRPTSTTLMDISESQRDQLARDWRKGRRIILQEYQRTRQRMRRASRRFRIPPPWQKTTATWALMLFAVVTLVIVIVRSWRGV